VLDTTATLALFSAWLDERAAVGSQTARQAVCAGQNGDDTEGRTRGVGNMMPNAENNSSLTPLARL